MALTGIAIFLLFLSLYASLSGYGSLLNRFPLLVVLALFRFESQTHLSDPVNTISLWKKSQKSTTKFDPNPPSPFTPCHTPLP